MVRRFLSDASYEALLRLADTYGAEVPESVTRDELEEIVQEAEDEWYAEHRESNSHPVRIGESKYNIQVSGMQDPAQEEVELPDSYNETRIVLMLRDPSWAFAYWDIRDSDRTAFQRSESFEGLTIRVFLLPDPNAGSGEASETFDIPITLIDNRWYINLPSQDVYYRLAIYANDEGGERELALSNVIFVSRSNLAEARNGEEASAADQILAQTGIQDMDLPDSGRRIPQRILDLVDEDLMFN